MSLSAAERQRRYAAKYPERVSLNAARSRKKNAAKRARTKALWYSKNRERILARQRKWREENADTAKAATRRWKKNNEGKVRALHKQWRDANATKVLAWRAGQRARKAAATVPLTHEEQAEVIALYAKARALTELTGEPYHVDHIKPLAKGGLHHPSNLQVLRGVDNLRKGAKYG